MLIALTLAAALSGPAASPPSETQQEARIIRTFGPGRTAGRADLDRNDDGFVTREEFTASQTAAFDVLDANKDGRISTEELASSRAAADVGVGGPNGPANVRLRMDGPGGPGGADASEVMMFRRSGPGGPGGDIRIHRIGGPGGPGGHEKPGDLDADHDGKVSEAEFLSPSRQAFQAMDVDHSGSLDAGEHGPEGGAHTFVLGRGPVAPPAN